MADLDSFDWQILALMQADSRRTGDQLAEAVGLSPAACLRRLQRLRKLGVIEREVAILSRAVAPKLTTVIVLLQITQHNPKQINQLSAKLRTLEEVQAIYTVTGQTDMVVVMKCPSMEDFKTFCDRYFFEAPVEGYETIVVLRTDFER
ncbi:MAG: Lrp/AsnC family transcriptional regulator [Pseudomonadota bacterium]